jgi:hypothetical protein
VTGRRTAIVERNTTVINVGRPFSDNQTSPISTMWACSSFLLYSILLVNHIHEICHSTSSSFLSTVKTYSQVFEVDKLVIWRQTNTNVGRLRLVSFSDCRVSNEKVRAYKAYFYVVRSRLTSRDRKNTKWKWRLSFLTCLHVTWHFFSFLDLKISSIDCEICA